jgi:hypothetical protein
MAFSECAEFPVVLQQMNIFAEKKLIWSQPAIFSGMVCNYEVAINVNCTTKNQQNVSLSDPLAVHHSFIASKLCTPSTA